MSVENYDYVKCDQRLFRCRFKSPIGHLDRSEQIERTFRTIEATVEAFEPIISPCEVEYHITERGKDDEPVLHEGTLTGDNITGEQITGRLRDMARELVEPAFPGATIGPSNRLLLADGMTALDGPEDEGIRYAYELSREDPHIPLKVSIGNIEIMHPSLTEKVDVRGFSEHWLAGHEEKYYHDPPTPLASVNQSRLEGAMWRLYEALEPTELTLDPFENVEGYKTPRESVPGWPELETQLCVEWVTENFERHWSGEDVLAFAFSGEEVDPLVDSADYRVLRYVSTAIPDDRYDEGTTVEISYPDETSILVMRNDGWTYEKSADTHMTSRLAKR